MDGKRFNPIDVLGKTLNFYVKNIWPLYKLLLILTAYAALIGILVSMSVAFGLYHSIVSSILIFIWLIPLVILIFIYFGIKLTMAAKLYIEEIYIGRSSGFMYAYKKTKGRFWNFVGASILVTLIYWVVSGVTGIIAVGITGMNYRLLLNSSYKYLISLPLALVLPYIGIVTTIAALRKSEVGSFKYNMKLTKGLYVQLLFFYVVVMIITNIVPITIDLFSISKGIFSFISFLVGLVLTPYLMSVPIVLLYELEDEKHV